jgi:centractin
MATFSETESGAGSADRKPHIVVDCGSGVLKAGFTGQVTPAAYFPSLIGKHKRKFDNTSTGAFEVDSNVFLIGEQAIEHRDKLLLQYPITHGVITDWDDVERLFHFTFKRCDVASKFVPLIM